MEMFPDALVWPFTLLPVTVLALWKQRRVWAKTAIYLEATALLMRLYSSSALVFLFVNCYFWRSCISAFTTVFSVPFFCMSVYATGFHAAALYTAVNYLRLLTIEQYNSGSSMVSPSHRVNA